MIDLEKENPYREITSLQKDGADTYMILSEDNHDGLPYQINMLRYNNIAGLLKVEFLIENRTYHYYYDISLKESLSKKMKNKKYTLAEIRTIMAALYGLTETLADYLLDLNAVILHPDYIYTDRDFKKVWFCFYPEQKSGFEKNLELLFEYFMDHLDYSEDSNVRIAYGLYQKVREENCSLKEIMSVFMDIEDRCQAGEEENMEEVDGWSDSGYAPDTESKENLEPESKKIKIPDYGKKVPGYIKKIPVFLLFVFCGLYLFSVKFELKRMDYAVIIVLALGLYLLINSFRMEKNEEKIKQSDAPSDENGGASRTLKDSYKNSAYKTFKDYYEEDGECFYENDQRKAHLQADRKSERNSGWESDYLKNIKVQDMDDNDSVCHAEKIPATMILSPDQIRNGKGVLVSKDKNLAKDIELEKESLLIGKLPGVADIILSAATISRIHARILKEDNKCYILDLGSSNGTFVNGKKIREREKVLLSPKDCVSFANVEFEYIQ